jgi:predicted ATPase
VVAVDGYTLESLVAFVRNGQIVDDTTLDLFASISEALKGLASAIEQVEARVRILENER